MQIHILPNKPEECFIVKCECGTSTPFTIKRVVVPFSEAETCAEAEKKAIKFLRDTEQRDRVFVASVEIVR